MKKKKFINKLLILIMTLLLAGCSNEKIYKQNGLEIKMAKGLFYKEHPTANVYYENEEIFFIALKENYSDLIELDINEETSIEDYVQEVFINREESFDLIKDENLYYYTYEYEVNNQTFYYVSTIHKSNIGFWICNFSCDKKNKEKYHNLFIKWAKTITFN